MSTPRVAQVVTESFDENELPDFSMDYGEFMEKNAPTPTPKPKKKTQSQSKVSNGWKLIVAPDDPLEFKVTANCLGLEYHKQHARVRFYVDDGEKKVYLIEADWKALSVWKTMKELNDRYMAHLRNAKEPLDSTECREIQTILNYLGSDDESCDQFAEHAIQVHSKTGVTVKSILDLRKEERGEKRRSSTVHQKPNGNPSKKHKKSVEAPTLPQEPVPPVIEPIQSDPPPVPVETAILLSLPPPPPPCLSNELPSELQVNRVVETRNDDDDNDDNDSLKEDYFDLLELEHQVVCQKHRFKMNFLRRAPKNKPIHEIVAEFNMHYNNK